MDQSVDIAVSEKRVAEREREEREAAEASHYEDLKRWAYGGRCGPCVPDKRTRPVVDLCS